MVRVGDGAVTVAGGDRVVQTPAPVLSRVMEVVMPTGRVEAFEAFVADAEPRLRRALTLERGAHLGRDATAEALAWAWEHWDRVQGMENPVGYLYRVGVSRSRGRRVARPAAPAVVPAPGDGVGFEPALDPALRALPARQRAAVVLVHACGWTHQEVAEALGVSRATVGTHLARGMARLRRDLGVIADPDHTARGGS